jgi:hypothetical protein
MDYEQSGPDYGIQSMDCRSSRISLTCGFALNPEDSCFINHW